MSQRVVRIIAFLHPAIGDAVGLCSILSTHGVLYVSTNHLQRRAPGDWKDQPTTLTPYGGIRTPSSQPVHQLSKSHYPIAFRLAHLLTTPPSSMYKRRAIGTLSKAGSEAGRAVLIKVSIKHRVIGALCVPYLVILALFSVSLFLFLFLPS